MPNLSSSISNQRSCYCDCNPLLHDNHCNGAFGIFHRLLSIPLLSLPARHHSGNSGYSGSSTSISYHTGLQGPARPGSPGPVWSCRGRHADDQTRPAMSHLRSTSYLNRRASLIPSIAVNICSLSVVFWPPERLGSCGCPRGQCYRCAPICRTVVSRQGSDATPLSSQLPGHELLTASLIDSSPLDDEAGDDGSFAHRIAPHGSLVDMMLSGTPTLVKQCQFVGLALDAKYIQVISKDTGRSKLHTAGADTQV